MKIGIHVSFLFRSDLSKRPIADNTLDSNTTRNELPQSNTPPMVGVPAFFAWSAAKSVAFSPVMALAFICCPN